MSLRHAATAALCAPPPPVASDECTAAVARFARDLTSVSSGLPRWHELVVTLPALRRMNDGGTRSGFGMEAFRWKPAFVRRTLGLAAVEACVAGRFRSPAEAVGPVAREAVIAWQRAGWRTYHWEPWLSYLPTGARAVVLAEATRWATSLWCAFDWGRLTVTRLGGPDEQWRCPTTRTLRLRGRVDVRVRVGVGPEAEGPAGGGGAAAHREALVVTAGGVPDGAWESELVFPVLVMALSRPRRPLPMRIMGLWPDAGEARTVEVDADVLGRAAERTVAAVSAMVRDEAGPEDRYAVAPDPFRSAFGSGSAASRSASATFPSGLPAAVRGISSTTSS